MVKSAIEAIVGVEPVGGGALKINFGSGTLTNAPNPTEATIAHGLGKTPKVVLVQSTKQQNEIVTFNTFTYDGTNFIVQMVSNGGTYVGTFIWVAIG